jgi:MoaA/NifB/PqqE/SkfB family radical SAM enzyme
MNNLKKIYEKFGENFCLAPFLEGFYQTNGATQQNSIRPCSLITFGDGKEWDITGNSILESRNNQSWKDLRKIMLTDSGFNDAISCKTCIDSEKCGTKSPRQAANEFFIEFLNVDIIEEVEKIINNNLESNAIFSLDYFPSNYCNYSCIMCAGGASSKRLTFEKKIGQVTGYSHHNNEVDGDFYELLDRVEIINFTGGETLLQKQVHTLIDYLSKNNISRNVTVSMLTNGSKFPEGKLYEKLKEFKKVVYTISVDGIGDTIEYQRRGSDWETVKNTALKFFHESPFHPTVNFVVTSVSVLSAIDFLDWCYQNEIKFFSFSPVFGKNYLRVSSMPLELRNLALDRLHAAIPRYEEISTQGNYMNNFLRGINDVIGIIEANPFNEKDYKKFIEQIKIEDAASKRPLVECVPEWADYIR